MVSPNVDKILRQARALSDSERKELRNLLEERDGRQSAQSKEERLAQALLEEGIITHIPPKPTQADIDRFNAWRPLPIQGKPLSETIIEDRR